MPGRKRKASFAFPYERPSKLSKKTSSTTVSRKLSIITKKASVVKPSLKMPKFPSLRATSETVEKNRTTEVTASAISSSSEFDSSTPPALRRASTLTLEDDSKNDSARASSLTKRKSPSKPASLTKKSSSFVEEGALVTKLSGLRSGSIVGETALAASTSLTKESNSSKAMSRKSSSVKPTVSSSKIPSLPSGLTKLAFPAGNSKTGSLHVSKSTLVSDIDETEMASALDSLKSRLSKDGSKKRPSLSKSASVTSSSSIRAASKEDDKRETMDTTTTSTADDRIEETSHRTDGLMEVAISFDTTGSMYGCLEEVKAKVQDLVQRLQADIPGIRVAVIAHGDYCDESNYVIKWIDFGASLPEICDFVKNSGRTGGGDGPECYELVLQRSREVLSWTEGSKRVLVMISDNIPHEPGYTYGGKTYHINWRDECAALKEMDVKIYGVQAGFHQSATDFNEEMARITGGKRLSLKSFGCIFDVLMMICYREGNPEMLAAYEQEIIDRGERMADDITSLKKTFEMPSTATVPMTFSGISPSDRGKGPILFKAGKAEKKKVKTLKPEAKKAVVKKSTTKRTVAKKAAPTKKTKKINKTVTVKLREKLPDSCMIARALKSFTWSKWICAVEPKLPSNKAASKFVKLRTNQGYGPKKIFDDNFKIPAIYEVAVQTPGSRKKYVVYFRMSKRGFTRRGLWATNILRHKNVRTEVNNVLKQGCSIYLRRALPKAKTAVKRASQMMAANDYIRDNYDYAWKTYIWRRSDGEVTKFGLKHRYLEIKRKGKTFTLSDNRI